MAQSHCNLLYHIVFSTKYREPWLDHALRPRVHAHIGGIIHDEGGIPLIINGVADHVHILAKLRQDKALSDVVRAIKAKSSGRVHRQVPQCKEFRWQNGYGSFTVSESQVGRVRAYIMRQEEHHRTRSFQEEFIALLEAHHIEYDPRYLWD
jgi:REP element-mobilizing transposase RayT